MVFIARDSLMERINADIYPLERIRCQINIPSDFKKCVEQIIASKSSNGMKCDSRGHLQNKHIPSRSIPSRYGSGPNCTFCIFQNNGNCAT